MSQKIIQSLRSCFRIEEANYDGSCRQIIAALYYNLYYAAPRHLTFYNNTFYWEYNHRYQPHYYRHSIYQTNRTFGDTKWFYYNAVNRTVDSGIILEGRNVNLEATFSTSGQTTLN